MFDQIEANETRISEATSPELQAPKRFQCRHIFTEGRRCGAPSLRGEDFCYHHHATRKPVHKPQERKARLAAFELPLPEDRLAIQFSIGEVLQRIAANAIDRRRAGLLLYGLQIASGNLPQPKLTGQPDPNDFPEEIVLDPQHGRLAPVAELIPPAREKSLAEVLMEGFERERAERHESRESHEDLESRESVEIELL